MKRSSKFVAKDLPTGRVDLKSAFLKPHVIIEPLIDSWYAWPHLLAPAQQALNLAFRYLPILKSFVANPAVHAAATAAPEMFGGPFVDLPVAAVDAVKACVATTEARRAPALIFAEAFRKLDASLRGCDGYSLNETREKAPEVLQGRCEFVYSLGNYPKIRLLEEMFDEDDMGHGESQELLLHATPDQVRPFFLSTPRLDTPDSLRIATTFGSEITRKLARARKRGIDLIDLAGSLQRRPEELLPFFTSDPPRARARYDGEGVRLSYFGHAAVLVETRELTILLDPTMAYSDSNELEHFTFSDLPEEIDILFISHGHQDHFSPEILLQLRDRVGLVAIPPSNSGEPSDPSLARMLRSLGFGSIRTLLPLETLSVAGGRIVALPFTGEHCDLDVHAKQCALVELKGRRLCFFVDSDAIDFRVYHRLAAKLRNPDVMFIGMECFGAPLSWLYGPLMSTAVTRRNDNSRRMSGANCYNAWRLVEELRPKSVFVYAMGQEPWMQFLMGLKYHEDSVQLKEVSAFIEQCRAAGVVSEHLYGKKVIEL